jgi:hypothetical protein
LGVGEILIRTGSLEKVQHFGLLLETAAGTIWRILL